MELKSPEFQIGLAQNNSEIEEAQRLRFRVFHDEMGAKVQSTSNLDADDYDKFCDHLKVTNQTNNELIGTYRLLRQSVAEQNIGFYSQNEFDIDPLLRRKKNLSFLELGRSCILKPYRGKAVLELLWQGIWDYARANQSDVMLGCASFHGTDISEHAEALSFLAHYASAPDDWKVSAHASRYQNMAVIPKNEIDVRRAISNLPTLIKAYLRVGCYIGDGAVIDTEFNTTDVLVILPVSNIDKKYFKHYGAPIANMVSPQRKAPSVQEFPVYA